MRGKFVRLPSTPAIVPRSLFDIPISSVAQPAKP